MLETHGHGRRSSRRLPARDLGLGLAAVAALGVALGLTLHVWAAGGGRPTRAAPTLEGQAVWPPRSVPAPAIALRDQRGRMVTLSAQRGRTVLVSFMDSRCHEICPLEGRVLARAIAALPAETRPVLLVVSVDPWADTRSSAAAAAAHWGFDGDWHWLLGTRRELARVWRSYRIYVKRTSRDIVHSDAVYLVDGNGFERAGFLFPFLPGPVERDLTALAGGSVR